jgi:hypothetical protein
MNANDLTIAQAIKLLAYGASCEDCHEIRYVDLAALPLPPDTRVGDIRQHLRCATCGGKNIITTKLWRSATTTEAMVAKWKPSASAASPSPSQSDP